MFPIRDDNPQILRPYATYAIVACNALAWFYLQGAGMEPALSTSVCRLGLIPGELLQRVPAGTQFPVGPGAVCVTGDTSTWPTAITSMFLHGGWFHLIGNMCFLWIFGNNAMSSPAGWPILTPAWGHLTTGVKLYKLRTYASVTSRRRMRPKRPWSECVPFGAGPRTGCHAHRS